MTRRSRAALMAGLLFASTAVGAAEHGSGETGAVRDGPFSLGAQASTLGWGVSGGYDVSDSLSARAMFNHFDYSFDRTRRGNKFEGDLELLSFGLMMDWHPFDGGFRVTGGAFLNNSELVAGAKGENVKINDRRYSGNLDLKADFDRFAPYLGVGYTGGRDRGGFGFVFDAGVLFSGVPNLSASGSASGNAGSCDFEVDDEGRATLKGICAEFGSLKSDLEREHTELTRDLDDFKLYPVVSLGALYRF